MAKEIKSDNYFSVQGWMVSEMKLKGNELIIYAIIYGFSQDGKSRYTGSLQYLCNWTGMTKQGVMNCLGSLTEKGFLNKYRIEKNSVIFVEYVALRNFTTMQNTLPGYANNLDGGMQKTLPNNILDINTNIDDDDDNKQTDIYKTPTSSWEDIKKEQGIGLDLKEIAKEIIQDNAYLEYLAMDLGRLKVAVNIPLVKEYVNQAYLRLRIVNKIKHKDRSDGRNHIRNLILKDAKGSRELYDMAKRDLVIKNSKNDNAASEH